MSVAEGWGGVEVVAVVVEKSAEDAESIEVEFG
jgi:hypothetical protein